MTVSGEISSSEILINCREPSERMRYACVEELAKQTWLTGAVSFALVRDIGGGTTALANGVSFRFAATNKNYLLKNRMHQKI